ncbi:MAG: AI-2E family transporter [Nitrospirae bacterium]|nr:AI-2E family transporter [Nitrospirota bacterium]
MPAPAAGRPWERPLAWVLWTALIAALAALLYVLKGALLPFLIAFVIAYVFAPWVDLLERRAGLPRPLGTALVFVAVGLILAGLVAGLLPVFQEQFTGLIRKLPEALAHIRDAGIPLLSAVMERLAALGLDDMLRDAVSRFWADPAAHVKAAAPTVAKGAGTVGAELAQATAGIVGWVASGAARAVAWLVGAAIVPILVFYLLMDFHAVAGWLRAQLPAGNGTLARIDAMLGEFLRGQLTVGVILSVLYAAGLTLAGVEGAVTIGIIAGIGNMVPYLGFVIGITLALLITLLTHFDVLHLVYVLLVFGVVQMIEGAVISPRVVGERVGLHPLAVILALFVGGEAFGFLGVLLGVPAAIVAKAVLQARAGDGPAGNGAEHESA